MKLLAELHIVYERPIITSRYTDTATELSFSTLLLMVYRKQVWLCVQSRPVWVVGSIINQSFMAHSHQMREDGNVIYFELIWASFLVKLDGVAPLITTPFKNFCLFLFSSSFLFKQKSEM